MSDLAEKLRSAHQQGLFSPNQRREHTLLLAQAVEIMEDYEIRLAAVTEWLERVKKAVRDG